MHVTVSIEDLPNTPFPSPTASGVTCRASTVTQPCPPAVPTQFPDPAHAPAGRSRRGQPAKDACQRPAGAAWKPGWPAGKPLAAASRTPCPLGARKHTLTSLHLPATRCEGSARGTGTAAGSRTWPNGKLLTPRPQRAADPVPCAPCGSGRAIARVYAVPGSAEPTWPTSARVHAAAGFALSTGRP